MMRLGRGDVEQWDKDYCAAHGSRPGPSSSSKQRQATWMEVLKRNGQRTVVAAVTRPPLKATGNAPPGQSERGAARQTKRHWASVLAPPLLT